MRYMIPFAGPTGLGMILSAAVSVRGFDDKFGSNIVAELISHTGIDARDAMINKGGEQLDIKRLLVHAGGKQKADI